MDHEMKQAMMASARRERAEAVAALVVAAVKRLRAQAARLRRAWVADVGVKRARIDSVQRPLRQQTKA
jgi:hypothetical protein